MKEQHQILYSPGPIARAGPVPRALTAHLQEPTTTEENHEGTDGNKRNNSGIHTAKIIYIIWLQNGRKETAEEVMKRLPTENRENQINIIQIQVFAFRLMKRVIFEKK